MFKKLKRSICAAVLSLISLSAGAVYAQDLCDGDPVSVLSPFGGGVSDVMARLVFDEISKSTGQVFNVVARKGAGGVLATRELVEASPNGCTLSMIGQSQLVIAPLADVAIGYDPIADVRAITMIGGSPAVIAVQSGKGIQSIEQLSDVYGTGQKATFSTPGALTITRIFADLVFDRLKVGSINIPYASSGEAVADAVSGSVDLTVMTFSTLRGQIEAGTLTPLVVSSIERLDTLPNVPTVDELGFQDLTTLIWFGVGAPAGLSDEMAQNLSKEIMMALDKENVLASLDAANISVDPVSGESFRALIRDQIATYSDMTKSISRDKP